MKWGSSDNERAVPVSLDFLKRRAEKRQRKRHVIPHGETTLVEAGRFRWGRGRPRSPGVGDRKKP